MFGFGFFPFMFIGPLIFFFVIARVIGGFVRGFHRSRYLEDESPYTAFPSRPRPSASSRPTQGQIFKLAYRLKGRITISDLVVETGLEIAQAEQLIESMVDGTRVRMEVDDHGMVTYEFPEIIRRFEE